MPAVYAHYRFGKLLISSLPAGDRQRVQRFRRLYDMGLQGPDFFYYYNPLLKTKIGGLGDVFHRESGETFFSRVCAREGSEAAGAYLLGLLAHYCLDSVCHPFVHRMHDEGKARHAALEAEFERYLMELDGIAEPHGHDLRPYLRLTRGECVTVAGFYPPATPGSVNSCVKSMRRSLRFLNRKERKGTVALLKTFTPGLLEHIIPSEKVPGYDRMCSELLARFNRCLKDYPRYLEAVKAHTAKGEPLGEDFAAVFG